MNLLFLTHPGKLPEGPDPPLGGGDVVDHRDAQHRVKAVVLQGGGDHQPICSDREKEKWIYLSCTAFLWLCSKQSVGKWFYQTSNFKPLDIRRNWLSKTIYHFIVFLCSSFRAKDFWNNVEFRIYSYNIIYMLWFSYMSLIIFSFHAFLSFEMKASTKLVRFSVFVQLFAFFCYINIRPYIWHAL